MKRRIGILTSGGDCPGLNAAIRGVARAAYEMFDAEIIGIHDGYRGLIDGDYSEMKRGQFSGILTLGGTILGTSRTPFRDMRKIGDDNVDKVAAMKKTYKDLKLDCLVTLGGNGTHKTANLLSQEGLNVIGLPKTIDNDLYGTDFTFGFHTANDIATEVIDRIHTTAASHGRCMVVEIMGNKAGWLTLYSGVAGGADVILIPEIPFRTEKIIEKIWERENRGRHFSIIVVAEGAKEEGGEMVVQKYVKESHDPIRLGGIADYVAHRIEALSNIETRVTVLGHLQRGGAPVPYDRILSTRYGAAAVQALMRGEFGKMVSLNGDSIVTVSIQDAIEDLKKIDPNGEIVRAAKAVGISFGD